MNSSRLLGVSDKQMRCPLAGAAKAIALIEGAEMIIIGTEECTFYTKATLAKRGVGDRCHSLVLDSRDVTFGCGDKVAATVDSVMRVRSPKALFLVTTCVVEVIGEDYTSIALDAESRYGIPVKVIQTCHFKGESSDHGWQLVARSAAAFAKVPSRSSMLLQRIKDRFLKSRSHRAVDLATLPKPSYRMGLLWTLLRECDAPILEYGTAGTTAYAMKYMRMQGIDTADRLFTTGLTENDLVMGDPTSLESALLKIDQRYSPRVIFLLSSAVCEVTGVDVKGVGSYMQESVKARIVTFTGSGFGGEFDQGVLQARLAIEQTAAQ